MKEELDRLEAEHIIAKVEEPIEWVNPIVNVLKPNKQLRICLDPQKLNEAITREHYALPVASDRFARISGAKVYSTLDTTAGFHQIELEEQSSYYTTFITAYGRYRYLSLPFGVKSAPEVMHKAIEGVECYIDDILVWGRDQAEHDERLRKVLQKCREEKPSKRTNAKSHSRQ